METDFDLSWMAWTWPTAAFFIFIALAIASMAVWEYFSPGGAPRRGIFGIDTTRGDRLFMSLLGSAFIFLGWLGLVGQPLWAPLGISVLWTVLIFRFA
jgi:predicted small integral membrane protein